MIGNNNRYMWSITEISKLGKIVGANTKIFRESLRNRIWIQHA